MSNFEEDLGDQDSSGKKDDDDDDDDEPLWVPAMLESTQARVRTAKKDAERVRGCMLCELATGETGCAAKFGEILSLERKYRRAMTPDILYKAIRDKYNDQIVRMILERYPTRNAREITLPEVRLHFDGNHDRDFKRMLENKLDYIDAAANQLEQSALWLRDAKKDPVDGPLKPDFRHFEIYIKLTSKMRELYRDMTGLGVTGPRIGKPSDPKR